MAQINEYLETELPIYRRLQILRKDLKERETQKRDVLLEYFDKNDILEYKSANVIGRISESQQREPNLKEAIKLLGAERLIEQKALYVDKGVFDSLLKVSGIAPKESFYMASGSPSRRLNVTIIPPEKEDAILRTTAKSLAEYLENFARS